MLLEVRGHLRRCDRALASNRPSPSLVGRFNHRKKYPNVMSQSTGFPSLMNCSITLPGHVARCFSLYGTAIKWSAPLRSVFPHWKLNMNPLSLGSLNIRSISVRVSSSPRFVVTNATLKTAMSRASMTLRLVARGLPLRLQMHNYRRQMAL